MPCLHFEACYYQPLSWCIEHGYARFEGGAQGEHKMARGLLPVLTHSAHWLSHPGFSDAVARHLEREGAGIEAYVDELRERNPFKSPARGLRHRPSAAYLLQLLPVAMPPVISACALSGPSQPWTLTHLPASRSL